MAAIEGIRLECWNCRCSLQPATAEQLVLDGIHEDLPWALLISVTAAAAKPTAGGDQRHGQRQRRSHLLAGTSAEPATTAVVIEVCSRNATFGLTVTRN